MTTKPRVITDPIQAIDEAYAQGIDTWEAMVSIGVNDEEDMTIRRWRQGDLAIRIQKHYGENTLTKFATAITVNTSTLKQRKVMSTYYQKDTRVSFPNCGYSHFREAMKLGNIDKSLWALEKASIKDWPVWKFGMLLNRLLGKKSGAGGLTGFVVADNGTQVVIDLGPHDTSALYKGQSVTLKVK